MQYEMEQRQRLEAELKRLKAQQADREIEDKKRLLREAELEVEERKRKIKEAEEAHKLRLREEELAEIERENKERQEAKKKLMLVHYSEVKESQFRENYNLMKEDFTRRTSIAIALEAQAKALQEYNNQLQQDEYRGQINREMSYGNAIKQAKYIIVFFLVFKF